MTAATAQFTAEGYGAKPLVVFPPQVVLKSAPRDVAGLEGAAAGRFSCAQCDEAEPAPEPVSIEAAARAALQVLAKAPDASWTPITELAARLGIEPGLELLAALAAGGWRDAVNPEAWLKAKLRKDAPRERIRDCRRARHQVAIRG